MVDQRVQRGRGIGGGLGVGNPVLRQSAPGTEACDWPRLAMVAGATSTELLWRWRSPKVILMAQQDLLGMLNFTNTLVITNY